MRVYTPSHSFSIHVLFSPTPRTTISGRVLVSDRYDVVVTPRRVYVRRFCCCYHHHYDHYYYYYYGRAAARRVRRRRTRAPYPPTTSRDCSADAHMTAVGSHARRMYVHILQITIFDRIDSTAAVWRQHTVNSYRRAKRRHLYVPWRYHTCIVDTSEHDMLQCRPPRLREVSDNTAHPFGRREVSLLYDIRTPRLRRAAEAMHSNPRPSLNPRVGASRDLVFPHTEHRFFRRRSQFFLIFFICYYYC